MTSRFARLSAAAVAVVFLAAACSDDSDDSSTGTAPTDAVESTGDPGTGASDTTDADIVDTAVAAGDFDTLVAAVQAAGLEETLRGEGPYTVFAPTDAAFDALPAGTVDALLADQDALAGILTYHVVEGEVLAADVTGLDGQQVTTVNGATFTVQVADDGSVTLTDATGNTVNVTQTDIKTSNGVIHVIDGVLLPA